MPQRPSNSPIPPGAQQAAELPVVARGDRDINRGGRLAQTEINVGAGGIEVRDCRKDTEFADAVTPLKKVSGNIRVQR
jgi:hypothetical protein